MNNNNNSNRNIHTEFYDYFHYEKKDKYYWNLESVSKDDQNKRSVFSGQNKQDENDCVYVKQIKLSFNFNDKYDTIQILREIYFLVILRNQPYIVPLEDILLDNTENCTRVFLIFKGNNVSLNKLISYSGDYLSNKDLIKWILYQISYGLYILHSNKIIHNDIKPSNVLINQVGGVTICDFGSAAYKEEESNSFTRYYVPPEFLNDLRIIRDEKSDIWGLGVIMIELYLKKNRFFKCTDDIKNNENQLKYLLSKCGFGDDKNYEDIKKLGDIFSDAKIQFSQEEIKLIDDKEAIDLINHLLCLDPNKRYNIKQVLDSKYFEVPELKEYKKSLDIQELDGKNIYKKLGELINENKFFEIISELICLLNELKQK